MKWVATRPYIGNEIILTPREKDIEMFFAFRSFDHNLKNWRSGKTSLESLFLDINCNCNAFGCPDVIRKCTLLRKTQD